MANYLLKTLGCKANFYDSQALEESLQKRGWNPSGTTQSAEKTELCIINSCSVTNEADRQTRKLAAKLSRENPQAVVVVTGCGAEIDPEKLAATPGVHFVVGNQNKTDFADLVLKKIDQIKEKSDLNSISIDSHILSTNSPPDHQEKIIGTVSSYKQLISRHPLDREWPALTDSFRTPSVQLSGHTDKTRAFLKIQEGCDSFCTYCIIPYGRGPSRSLQIDPLLEQIRELLNQDVREVILTGTNIGDYGRDWAGRPELELLISRILNETDLKRLRVSSLDPVEITPGILDLMKNNPRFCPHFHVSLQSPHSRILRLMKRKYGFEEVKACLEKIQEISALNPGATPFVGMDIITGFPGESEEEFQWGYDRLSELPWTRLHVFPYSERTGTAATRLPGVVPNHKRVERSRRLNALGFERLKEHYQKVLKASTSRGLPISNVLLERTDSKGWTSGYTPDYLRVMIRDGDSLSRNELVSVNPIELITDPGSCDVAILGRVCS